jgi:hypothetical protein
MHCSRSFVSLPRASSSIIPLHSYDLIIILMIHATMQFGNTLPARSRSASIESYVSDTATEACIYKHCHVGTAASTQEAAQFHMRSHMRITAHNSVTGSHPGCRSTLLHPDSNPFYILEEYCGITLGRDVERMVTVQAEDACFPFQFYGHD